MASAAYGGAPPVADSRTRSAAMKMLKKAEMKYNEGDFYEAHQIYRIAYARFRAKELYNDAMEAIRPAILLFTRCKCIDLAKDLALLIIETLTDRRIPVTTAILENLSSICGMFDSDSDARVTIIEKAILYTKAVGNPEHGDNRLYKLLAEMYWKEKNFGMAIKCLMYGNAETLAGALVDLSITFGYNDEADLIITNCILQLLCSNRKNIAAATLQHYVKTHPQLSGSRAPLPLINFLNYVIRAVETGDTAFYETVISLYSLSLSRDVTFFQYLTQIGKVYFKKTMSFNTFIEDTDKSYIVESLTRYLMERKQDSSNSDDVVEDARSVNDLMN
ncbi:Golgi to ER traffic protein 4-like protein B [Trichoplax sp. H2]|nr:Golgi to ER traffic protein 4-like protein B [Trichoplax sp. H2]|eukprot:RDD42075.1 Golgi to ER traffic protein 4-like protein B [Trichoplax sp. H2]